MNKYAVITGASKGIGKATAELLISGGYQVINISRGECNVAGVLNLAIDMTVANWVQESGDALLKMIGQPDELVIVHNAAVLLKDTVETVTVEQFQEVLMLNVTAPAVLTGLLRPVMGVGSSVLFVSSTLGHKAVANSCTYVTSKHALIGLMRSTCQDLAGTGVHTAAICPGFTDTEMLRSHIGTDPAVEQSIASTIAMGRLIEPYEIAKVIVFCAQNPVVNGAIIDANLGQIEQ
ncbi:MAG: SDR family oxidoreductase [Pseudomonadota bacterium]